MCRLRLVAAKKLPAGEFNGQIVASPAGLRGFFARVAIGRRHLVQRGRQSFGIRLSATRSPTPNRRRA
jgi:acyl CoA:acetate/3-ketoacid CoA transferase alpha subunit